MMVQSVFKRGDSVILNRINCINIIIKFDVKHPTYDLQTLNHPMEDVGLNSTLCPVLLQHRQDVVHLITLLLPAQTFKVAVVQHQWVVYCHTTYRKKNV